MLWSRWSHFFLWFSNSPVFFQAFVHSLRVKTTTGIAITFTFQTFQHSVKIQVFAYLFVFFYFWTLWSAGMAKSTFLKKLTLGLVFWAGLGDPFVCQYLWEFYVSLSWTDSGLCIFRLSAEQNFSLLHNFQRITLPTQSCIPFVPVCIINLCGLLYPLYHHISYTCYSSVYYYHYY